MSGYSRLVKDFFQKINSLNPLHYYGYEHMVRGEDARSEDMEIILTVDERISLLRNISDSRHEK